MGVTFFICCDKGYTNFKHFKNDKIKMHIS